MSERTIPSSQTLTEHTEVPLRLTPRGRKVVALLSAGAITYTAYAAVQYGDPELSCRATQTYQLGEHPTYDTLAGQIQRNNHLRASIGRIVEKLEADNPTKPAGELQPDEVVTGPAKCSDSIKIFPFSYGLIKS